MIKRLAYSVSCLWLGVVCCGGCRLSRQTPDWGEFVKLFGRMYEHCPIERSAVVDLRVEDIGFEKALHYARIKYDVSRRSEIIRALRDDAKVPPGYTGTIRSELRQNVTLMMNHSSSKSGLPSLFTPEKLGAHLQILTIQWSDPANNYTGSIHFYFSDHSDEAYLDNL